MNLLIADDEFLIRRGLESLNWNEAGIHVIGVVENGIDACEIMQSEIVDIVIADIRMPGMSGIELAEFIKNNDLATKVILLSGYNDFEYAQSAISYSVFAYLLKPSNPREIIEKVKQAKTELEKIKEKNVRIKLLESELAANKLIVESEKYYIADTPNSSYIVSEILKYIHRYYNRNISLSTLSEHLHFSSIYLSRLIKKETGYTFLEILTMLRMKEAALLLKNTPLKIQRVCESVGVKDQRYFSQVFKKYFGMTPNEMRKSSHKQDSKTFKNVEALFNESARK